MSLPDFFIIGAMKCATSSIHDQLNELDGFHLSEPKEPNFFSDDEQYAQGLDWYHALFSLGEGKIKGESSTHYTKFPTYPLTIQRMKDAGLSSPKLIYVVREPVDRLVSQYIHEWSENKITEDINQAIYNFPRLIEYSKYSYQLDHYLAAFDDMSMQIVFFEALRHRPDQLLQDICEFIGYRAKPIWDHNLEASNISSKRIRKFPLYDVLVDSKPMELIRRNFIPKSLRERVKQNLTMSKRPVLSEESRGYLNHIFDQDLALLGEKLGIELNTANYKERVAEGLTTKVIK